MSADTRRQVGMPHVKPQSIRQLESQRYANQNEATAV